jgi:pyrroline-5-carboxylate reductase
MVVGLIGAGNMARALARGWGDPVLVVDAGSGRARALVDELGGEAMDTNAGVAARADVLVLACKPHQLDAVGSDVGDYGGRVVSVLGATPLERLRAAFPAATVVRTMPNTPVEVGRGVIAVAAESPPDADLTALLERVGDVVLVPEPLMDVATGASGVTPAYVALVAEAMIEACVKHGLKQETAARLVVGTLEGSAALLAARGADTLAVRREVTSPGGSTARGLAALERGGLRAAFLDALDAVVSP